MDLRKAYETVIWNELDTMRAERGWDFDQINVKELIQELSDNERFHQYLTDAVEDYLSDFGDEHDVF